jgi:hypothetical protein
MSGSQGKTKKDRNTTDKMKITALGLAYLLVGVGFFYSLATDSIQLFTAVLVGIL